MKVGKSVVSKVDWMVDWMVVVKVVLWVDG